MAGSNPLDEAVVVAIGGNLPGAHSRVRDALEAAVTALGARLPVSRRSGWWRSRAWPDPSAPAFLNAVALVVTPLGPSEVLGALLQIEQAAGRRRGAPNAARTLDLDLVAYGRIILDEPSLTLPHPRAHERLFVMGPLAEIAPGWVHPVLGRTAVQLAGEAPVGRDARPV